MTARLAILIVILVFGILFSMMFVSGAIASDRQDMQMKELQAAPRVNAGISKMIEPENICFTMDEAFLDKYPAFGDSISEADYSAEIDIKTNSSYGNYYSGVGLGLSKNETLSLVRAYYADFNQTINSQNTPDGRFTHQNKRFSCGFVYEQKYYQLDLSFETLQQVNRDAGYVSVFITKELVEKKGDLLPSEVTFAPWNNTVVFFNQLTSAITIELTNMNGSGGGQQRSETFTVLPNTMIDLPLSADWSSLDDATYHYKVKEYPWIQGYVTVSTKYTNGCMTIEIAKSLYAQSDFELEFPSYLPEGFRPVCNAENTDTYLIQIYANQSATDYHTKKA